MLGYLLLLIAQVDFKDFLLPKANSKSGIEKAICCNSTVESWRKSVSTYVGVLVCMRASVYIYDCTCIGGMDGV